ncbi:MAG TPA: WecB/TagA/CpsF family glycosyltransferase [bacterium]|nr:WecB/TagA/CpsF family glycosyltransferase [bacterium]
MDSINILDCRLDYLDPAQIEEIIKKTVKTKRKIRISNLNIYAANLAYENRWYQEYVNNSAVVHCDSKGIQLAAIALGKRPPLQITYHTWGWRLFEFCDKNKLSIFFLGSDMETLREAIQKVKSRFPNLKLGGHHGYFEKTGLENRKVINEINRFQPSILMVGFGMPLQEKWIKTNEKSIHANVFCNGGAFLDWISGKRKTAPSIVTKIGLEWFYRLLLEPKRLYRRYVFGIPQFFIRLIGSHYLGMKRKS